MRQSHSSNELEEYRDLYTDQFRDLERQVSDLLGGMPGSSRGHQLLQRRFASLVATFNGLLASPLTSATVDRLGDVYVGLAEFSGEVESAGRSARSGGPGSR